MTRPPSLVSSTFLPPPVSKITFYYKERRKKSSRTPLTPSLPLSPLTCEGARGGRSSVGAAPPSPGRPGPSPPAAPMHPFYSRAATMIGEIAAAVSFISKFLRTKGLTSERQLQTFSQSLQELLAGERAVVAGGRGTPRGEGRGRTCRGRAVG